MNKLWVLVACALLALGAAAPALASSGYIHSLTGTATVRVGNAAPRPLKAGDIIDSGQTIATGPNSAAVVKFEDGQLAALAADSSFTVQDYAYNKQNVSASRAIFNVLRGGLRFVTGVIGATNRNAVTLRAGTATIGIRGTDVVIHLDALTQAITAAVAQGAVAIGNLNVTAGQIAAAQPGSPVALAAQGTVSSITATLITALTQVNIPVNTPINVAASARAVQLQAQATATADPVLKAQLQAQADTALEAAVAAAVVELQAAIKAGGATPVLVQPPTDTTTPAPLPTQQPAPILTPSPS